jgi:predicted Zn-dependent protease
MFGRNQGGGMGGSAKLLIAVVLAGFALSKYYCNSSYNELTGEKQHISISPDQEVAMGLQSAPQMIAEMGGAITNHEAAALVQSVGERVVAQSDAAKTVYRNNFRFHLLNDPNTINAFALPGGQIFITTGLLSKMKTEDQLAGVLGHEVGHVVARHSAEKLAQMELAQGLTGAVTMATYDPGNPNSGYIAQMVSNMLQMKYGREQESGKRRPRRALYDAVRIQSRTTRRRHGNPQTSQWPRPGAGIPKHAPRSRKPERTYPGCD